MRTITAEWFRLRWATLERDGFTCQYCGRAAPDVQLQVDHRVPVVSGGSDDPSNLVTACYPCNQGKEYSRWTTTMLATTKGLFGTGAPRGGARGARAGSKTALIATLLDENPALTDAEIAETAEVTIGSAHSLRYRIRKRTRNAEALLTAAGEQA